MKKILLFFLSIQATLLFAQQSPQIRVLNSSLSKVEETLSVSFDLEISDLDKNSNLIIKPVLLTLEQEKMLQEITVGSRKREIIAQRNGLATNYVLTKSGAAAYSYSLSIPYELWMNKVSLLLQPEIEDCCEIRTLPSIVVLKAKELYSEVTPIISPMTDEVEQFVSEIPYVQPIASYSDSNDSLNIMRDLGCLTLHFDQLKTKVDLEYGDNKANLESFQKVIDRIKQAEGVFLKKVVIIGYASPEGNLERNNMLAEKRANNLAEYLVNAGMINRTLINTRNGGEDWYLLEKMVRDSNMPDREAVLETIAKYDNLVDRNYRLMDINLGIPYRYMLEHFFPVLRSAGYLQLYVDYPVQSRAKDSLVNSAVDLLNNKKYEETLNLLEGAESNGKIENIRGACYLMLLQYDKALNCFEKAVEHGDKEAKINLENLRRLRMLNSGNK